MKWAKVVGKCLVGLVSGIVASVVANPESITTVAGAANATKVSAVVAIIAGILNWYKNKDK